MASRAPITPPRDEILDHHLRKGNFGGGSLFFKLDWEKRGQMKGCFFFMRVHQFQFKDRENWILESIPFV